MVGDGFGQAFNGLITILVVAVVVAILGFGYFIYNTFFANKKTFKTLEKPEITWELKAKGKTVDTVWIYKFK
jgi:ABC-type phosphate transport system permease subunit